MWSVVGDKGHQRWLWHAIDHHSGAILAYVLGTHTDKVFVKLKQLLAPFGMTHFYTYDWGTYQRKSPPPAPYDRGKRIHRRSKENS